MADKWAFEANASFDEASVALPDGTTFDVGKALRDGKGKITTDDEQVALVLGGFHALKPVTAASRKTKGE